MIKETLRLDTFYSVHDSVLQAHKNYPPIATLYGVLWCELFGIYSEAYIIRAYTFLGFSFLSILFEERNRILNLLIIVITTCMFKEFSYLFYQTIYSDPLTSIIIGYSLYLILTSRYQFEDIVIITVSLSYMVLTKQIMLAFYLLGVFSVLINMVLNKKINIKNLLLIIIIPIVFYYTWNSYIDGLNIKAMFNLQDIDFINWYKLFLNNDNSYQSVTAINFVRAILNKPIFLFFSYGFTVLIICVILGLVTKNKKAASIYFLGSIGYAFLMMVTYIYTFTESEAVGLASFDRYMSSYLVSGIIILMYCILKKDIKYKACYLIIAFIVSLNNIINLKPEFHYTSYGDEENAIALSIKEFINDGKGVSIISQYDTRRKKTVLNYYLSPKVVLGGSIGSAKYTGDYYSVDLSLKEFKEQVIDLG